MLTYLLRVLSNWFESAELRRREVYLARSSDVVELKQRIRALESSGFRSL